MLNLEEPACRLTGRHKIRKRFIGLVICDQTNPIDCTVPMFNSVDSEVSLAKFRFQLSKGDGGLLTKKMFFDCVADITAENRTQAQVELANSTQKGNEPGTLLL